MNSKMGRSFYVFILFLLAIMAGTGNSMKKWQCGHGKRDCQLTTPLTKTIQVESGIFVMQVAVKVTENAHLVKLLNPNDAEVDTNISSTANAKNFTIYLPAPGEWTLSYPESTGNFTFNVSKTHYERIEFNYSFQTKVNGRTFRVYDPIYGQENDLTIRVAGGNIIQIPTLRVDITDYLGRVSCTDLKLNTTNTTFVFKTRFVPRPSFIKIVLKGQKKDGTSFRRVSKEVRVQEHFGLELAQAGNDYTVRLGDQNVDVKFQELHRAKPASYNISISANVGSVSPQRIFKRVDGIGIYLLDLKYKVPANQSLIGSYAFVTVAKPGERHTVRMLITA